jgi:rubredoxin
MSNYPARAWNDPNAPWNELRCPMCGELVVKVVGLYDRQECTECDWEYEEDYEPY